MSFSAFTIKFDVMKDMNKFNKFKEIIETIGCDHEGFFAKIISCLNGMIELNGLKLCNGVILSKDNYIYNLEYRDIYVPCLRLAENELSVADKNMQYLVDEIDYERLESIKDQRDDVENMIKSYKSRLSSYVEECIEIIHMRFISTSHLNGFYRYFRFYEFDKIPFQALVRRISPYIINNRQDRKILVKYLLYKYGDIDELLNNDALYYKSIIPDEGVKDLIASFNEDELLN